MRLRHFAIASAVWCSTGLAARAADQAGADPTAPPPAATVLGPLPAADATPSVHSPETRTLTIVLGGDTGLGGSREPIHPDGAHRHGTRHGWATMTAGLGPLMTGDLNFANLETVVSDRRDLSIYPKAFNFRGHPEGLRHLTGLGLNLLSVANNHAIDYGEAGLEETMRSLETARAHGLLAWHGLGRDREQALQPARLEVKGVRVTFSAVGIGGRDLTGSNSQRAGMLSYHSDFEDAATRLAGTDSDLRILSVHYGSELQVRASPSDERKLRDAITKGIDIVAGHHAHVAAGVQDIGGRLVFYGLGNLLHPGMQDMARFNMCRDYGLVARVHISPGPDGRLSAQAVEAIPLTDMHVATRPMETAQARQRIAVLNHLASGLDDAASGASGVRFAPQPDGRGLYCRAGAAGIPGKIGDLCRGWSPPEDGTPEARRAAAACGGSIARAREPRPSGAYRQAEGPRPRLSRKRKKASTWFWF